MGAPHSHRLPYQSHEPTVRDEDDWVINSTQPFSQDFDCSKFSMHKVSSAERIRPRG
ncbi:hypothetical protein K449DRAFT_388032 [Hypoxylon sp. EC38]|nr:hypothetical protein K449DRAFT_388032 [Hypoxylon sp. EC38]